MNYQELVQLIHQLDQSSVAFLDYQTDNEHLVLSKEVPQIAPPKTKAPVTEAAPNVLPHAETPALETAAAEAEKTEKTEAEEAGEAVESPMVGVVYLQPHPDEEPYVKVGDQVEQGDVICIVEAMKLMNEIQSPYSGTVTEILVENEEVVEYKQPLIRIKQ